MIVATGDQVQLRGSSRNDYCDDPVNFPLLRSGWATGAMALAGAFPAAEERVMEEDKARTIVAALANGIDPGTGEALAGDSVFQSPDVVRALMCAVRALEAPGSRRDRADLPANAGKPWSPAEDERLLAEFDAGRSLKEMAGLHARTVAGIEARLERLGRLDADARTTPRRYPVRTNDRSDRGQRTPDRETGPGARR